MQTRRGSMSYCVACFIGLAVVLPFGSFPQLIAQTEGGTSTFDKSPGLSGNTGRRVLTSPLAVIPEDFAKLRLSPGFLLSMEVYDTPELSSELRVDATGDVTIPMIGKVHVQGQTVPEAAAVIQKLLLDGKILNNPQVTINVVQYAAENVTVVGEVHNPGRVQLLAPHTLAEVLAEAGGETEYAGSSVEVLRLVDGTPHKTTINYSRNSADSDTSQFMVMPGDTLTVRRAGVVYVLGAVKRPGGYLMQENGELNVTQAIALASGTEIQASVGTIRLIRKLPDGQVSERDIRLSEIQKGKEPPPKLQAEDVLYVPTSKMKIVLTSALLTTAATAAIYLH
jgi:polysaccharide export outer membrane protein